MQQRGEHERGRALIKEGLAMREETLGPDHPAVAVSLLNLGQAYEQRGGLGRGQAQLRAGAEHPREDGRARQPAGRLGDHRPSVVSQETVRQSRPLLGLGWAQLELEQTQEALATLERAYELRDRAAEQEVPGVVALLLSRAVTKTGGDPARARALRAEARKVYAKIDVEPPERIAGWMREPG